MINTPTVSDRLQSHIETILTSPEVENAILCEFSTEDNTPTIHVQLWRGAEWSNIPGIDGLEEVADGHTDLGPCASFQLPA